MEDHFAAGLAAALAGDKATELRELRAALQTQATTPEDEVQIRYFLGEALASSGPTGSVAAVLAAPEFSESIEQMEKALMVDRAQGVGYFIRTLNRARLRKLDLSYALMLENVLNTRGYASARAYLDQKLSLVSHLPSPPFVHTLVRATVYASEAGDTGGARRSCEILATMDPVVPGDEDEQRIRNSARADLRPAGKGGCFVATAVYGADAPQLAVLRWFRDTRLEKRALGRVFVNAYYRIGPLLASIVAKHPSLQRLSRSLIDHLLSTVVRTGIRDLVVPRRRAE